jgi:hypothetical protein
MNHLSNFLFLNSTMNTNVAVDGTFLESVRMLFKDFGILPILLSFLAVATVFIIYKYINFKMSDILRDKTAQIDNLTNRLIEAGKEEVNVPDSPINITPNNSESLRKHITQYGELYSHPLFYAIDYIVSIKINQTSVSSKIKKEIFKDYIEIKFGGIKKHWLLFLSNKDITTMGRDALKNKITEIFIDVEKELTEKVTKLNIPDLALNELNKSFQLADAYLFSSIETLTESNVFDDNTEIIYTILDLTMQNIEVSFHNIVLNLEKLNGELEKVGYNK